MIYDYVIIGAGPAGCFAAIELVKNKKTVVILEKNSISYRKVCGDGISKKCLNLLRKLNFPVDDFEKAGANRIRKYCFIKDGKEKWDNFVEEDDFALGLSRNKTDMIFHEYTISRGIEILYNNNVDKIEFDGENYIINNIVCRDYIIASGVNRKKIITGISSHNDNKSPLGISMIIRVDKKIEPYFLFDYDIAENGTYGWIFKIDDCLWNIGLWLKSNQKQLLSKFEKFIDKEVNIRLGSDYKVIEPARTALLGIGDLKFDKCIGDANNSCSNVDGEGISNAIVSSIEYVNKILKDSK